MTKRFIGQLFGQAFMTSSNTEAAICYLISVSSLFCICYCFNMGSDSIEWHDETLFVSKSVFMVIFINTDVARWLIECGSSLSKMQGWDVFSQGIKVFQWVNKALNTLCAARHHVGSEWVWAWMRNDWVSDGWHDQWAAKCITTSRKKGQVKSKVWQALNR